ncbi:uncharacterized protein OCT59_015238 [Rhizophagus irregularis]|uniref:Alpha-type protein kinase domain-containing protein n=1 Tax=Rhizophagus irregularis TaxID=588596 RepID=A0A915YYY5_9GLOM|nr:hypothetical protein OCT59_015238 [Rhizophagus irregularis]CAB4462815.1 unnamed protein product [Rhizophagus irregularis]CAB5354923.1 unnamed protein product [Rhizophagus irregularis]
MNPNEPNWNILPLQEGVVMWYHILNTLEELKDPNYFNKSNLFSKSLSFKIASQPFSAEYKRFNTNTGVITELRPTLEAFVHFTYEYTKGYLVVCDLQGIEHNDEFLLTDPSIHCINPLRFGRTNFGKEGIK